MDTRKTSLKKVNSFLIYLDMLIIEMEVSNVKPNLIVINKSLLDSINTYLPGMVKNKILRYNGIDLEIVSICDPNVGVIVSYGYGVPV
jgi:hypothetical protein